MYEIDIEACRERQRRLIEVMQQREIPLVIVTQREHVQWLVGPWLAPTFSPAAALSIEGHLTLVVPREPAEKVAADEVLVYEAKSQSTLRNDQRQKCSEVLLESLGKKVAAKKIGVEFSSFGPCLSDALNAELVDVEPDLYQLRRTKDADELALLCKGITATEIMHARAREMMRPGVNELDVFNELQAIAVREFGEPMTGTGNDFRCAARGGPPRDRVAQAGELYILDLGPAFRGYFADNARTYAVDGNPTDDQLRAWQACVEIFDLIEEFVRPGASCRELFQQASERLNAVEPFVFNSHLGHGIGLYPHEAPHLNPNWDDAFQVGEVFAVEPSLYGESLNIGMRIENDYLVTEDGVELLCQMPLEL